ncbi:hypothetical protein KC19_10G104000 [Ceratodon purpureus]|uniref:SAP domain-containing protein n=1 Tax=Ceratodon purpureus TaxID=3225 RepID=A0A8T0GMI1_CERPU|nr:hypothetical protein KC19_10G104000 [Ceratodon purpureus]
MSTPLAALGNRTPEQLKVAELREELRKRGIQIKGLKKDLVDRLEEVLKQEELEQQKALAAVVNDAAAVPEPVEQPEPVTPVTKRRSKGHDHHHAREEAKDVVVEEPDNAAVVASVEPEVAIAVPPPQEGDIVSQSVAESLPGGSEAAGLSVAGGADETAAAPMEGEPMPETIDLSVPVEEEAKVPLSLDDKKTAAAPPALEDLVADLERLEDPNYNKVVEEEPQVQQAVEEETGANGGEMLSGKSTDVVPSVEKGVDEVMGGTEEVITTTLEETVTTTVEEQVVAVVSDQNVVTVQEEQVVTTSTRVATVEETADEVVTTEDTTTTVATVEKTTTIVADGEGVKLDAEAVTLLEDKSDQAMGETSKEDAVKVANEDAIAETSKDETPMDVDAGTEKETILETPKDEVPTAVDAGNEKELNVEKPVEETPMDVDADAQKGSKRKDAVDGELITLEPTKRRRWNSAKGEGDSKGPGKDVPPLELQEPVPSLNAPAPSARVQTPKSAPPEKVAVTRTAPTRVETTVNGENQKTRVVPPTAKPATTSLKIDKFLRPFTFKAVKELLAQTGTVEDVWMDQIKTHCYVTYSSIEEATATRNALYNLQWPPQGGRLLTAEFVDPTEVKLRSDGEKAAAAAGPTATAAPSTNAITPRGGNSTNLKASKDGSIAPSSSHPSTPVAAALPPPPPLPFPPRDRSKQEVERTPTLDDLFRKTRSKPHIYYLPLTAEEVADKVATRNREAAAKPGVKA